MIRFAITHVNTSNMRTLTYHAQPRFMYPTRVEAEQAMAAILANSSPDRIDDVFGPKARETFEVREVDCWESEDPKSIWFD
jgi:hypothetical protein